MEGDDPSCPSPYPHPSDFLFKDISNFKTPKRPYKIPNFSSPSPQYFTASKETPQPSSSFRFPPSLSSRSRLKSKSANARRLMAIELEQSQSSRKVQIQKERSLRSLSKSLTTWLNFLFQSPTSCGCNVFSDSGNSDVAFTGSGKRDSDVMSCMVVGFDATWRFPKRQRDLTWKPADESAKKRDASSSSKVLYGSLQNSLKDVCSFDDLNQRMEAHFSFIDRNEIFSVMASVVKNIDGGRLTMKSHCPIVTDVGLKKKAILVLMHYNPVWLRIGLHVIFGGESLLPNGERESNSDQEIAFLKMVIEKHFFSHDALAKAYAYNKTVEGLYRPGYYEHLGNIILKRFFLLVLTLDRAKSQSFLPLKYGIDGQDGGSPPLFVLQSSIKSTRQVINDFLSSDVMHGEGNLLSHLVTIGLRVTSEQGFLVEYDFKMEDLFGDLHDGVRLCRAVQLMTNNPSILLKIVAPLDQKKKLANCSVALQYLKHAGVELSDEGITVVEDDIVGGDRELIVSLLWNMFVRLQLPLIINKSVLAEETLKIRGLSVDLLKHESLSFSHLELLFNWIQAICERYDHKLDNFSSMVDGKGIWCLLDFYFHKELNGYHSFKDSRTNITEESIMLGNGYFDAVFSYLSSHKLTSLLWNFPEVLKLSEVPEHNGLLNDRTLIILVAFIASHLIMNQPLDKPNSSELVGQSPERRYSSIRRHFMSQKLIKNHESTDMLNVEDARKYEGIKSWWADVTPSLKHNMTCKSDLNTERDNAARIIQWQYRKKQKPVACKSDDVPSLGHSSGTCFLDRAKLNSVYEVAATKIQSCIRGWIGRRNFRAFQHRRIHIRSAIVVQTHVHGWLVKRNFLLQRRAAIEIQSAIRFLNWRNTFRRRKLAAIAIQSAIRFLNWRNTSRRRKLAAVEIQRFARGHVTRCHFRSSLPHNCSSEISRCCFQHVELKVFLSSVLRLQRWWRCNLLLKQRTKASIIIQSNVRSWIIRKRTSEERLQYVALIQSCWRDYLARKNSRKQLLDLCLPRQTHAKDDNVDIISNLKLALRHLQKTQSASEILHICTIFDTFTHSSLTYCEELVAAGAIEALLELIRSGSRSIPDQEILKHALSILCNFVRNPHLAEFLIDCNASLEILLWEFLRNKEEGYFIVAEILKRICSIQRGAETLQRLPAWKRVHSLVEELTRKTHKCAIVIDKRKSRSREGAERRLIEAEELLNLTRNNSISSST